MDSSDYQESEETTMKTTKENIEKCINKIKALEKEFGQEIVYKASRRYYDRSYYQTEFVEE